MSTLGRLLGWRPGSPEPPTPPVPPSVAPETGGNLITVFDKYGRELSITREEWRTQVLPGNIQSNWDDPEQLYGIIVGALEDGLVGDVLRAAEQLRRIDPQPGRAACVLAIVLMKSSRNREAEQVLLSHLQRHGEDGVVLTNLAKVYDQRGQPAKAESTLRHGLEIDPNQDNGLSWYAAIHRDRSGEAAALDALRQVAALPGSWRAQVWLARASLAAGNLAEAMKFYQESLARVGQSIPADLLMQISGDLGNHGYLAESLQLTKPRYIPRSHGLAAGNNLIKAHLDRGEIDSARGIVEQLYALERPDWRETLGYWDTEIAKARVAVSSSPPPASIALALLTIEGPVWLKPSSPAVRLFGASSGQGPIVTFLGSSAEIGSDSSEIRVGLSDWPGRMSRALPLFLAEQIYFGSDAGTRTLVPWTSEDIGGFVLVGLPWADGAAAEYSRLGDTQSDFVVVSHVLTKADPWAIELRVVRADNADCIGRLGCTFTPTDPAEAINDLAMSLLGMLTKRADVKNRVRSRLYRAPGGAHAPDYLLRLEQLLAVRCSAMEGVNSGFLSGEREILDGNLRLCLACPENVPTRILLAQTVLTMSKVRPEIVREMLERLAWLQREAPLPEPAHSVVQGLLGELPWP